MRLNVDLTSLEEALALAFHPGKLMYIFGGSAHLMTSVPVDDDYGDDYLFVWLLWL